MSGYRFLDNNGTFELEGANFNNYLYFPLCNEAGMMSSITPSLGGDAKLDQNTFLLAPVSVEDLHNNKSTRNFWLRFKDGSQVSATGVSSLQKAKRAATKVRAGLLWHEAENLVEVGSSKLKCTITSFVPADATLAEVMRVTIAHTEGAEAVEFTPVAAVPIYGRSAVNQRDHRHVTSLLHRIYTEEYGVSVRPTLTFDERGHKHSYMEFYVAGCEASGKAPVGFYPTVEDFIGEGGDFENPYGEMSVGAGQTFEGLEAMGGLEFAARRLAPGETCEYDIFIGAHEREDSFSAPKAVVERLGGRIEEALEAVKAFWQDKLRFRVVTGDAEFDSFMLWVAAQPILRRIMGCSFLPYHDYGRGGRGWRDLWQDCLALTLSDPENVRDLLINNFAGVRADGTNATIIGSKPGEFLADRNNIVRVWMDHGVWPWMTTEFYMDHTGDYDLLNEDQAYFKDKQCMRARELDVVEGDTASGNLLLTENGEVYKGSLFEHLLLMHLTAAGDLGEHGHMALRGADWNDALDMAADRGESVAFTAAYAGNLKSMAELLRKHPADRTLLKEVVELLEEMSAEDTADRVALRVKAVQNYCSKVRHCVSGRKVSLSSEYIADKLERIGEEIMDHIRQTELMTVKDEDGRDLVWYNGYYDNEAEAVEKLEAGRVMLTSGVFTIMSGTATEDQVDGMIRTADKYLFDPKLGGYKLNTRFENEIEYATKLGRAFGFAYGTKENGAVFCHMAVMYAFALKKRGRVEAADRVIRALYEQTRNFEISRMYPGIPEYFGPKGRGMYTYLTGAASWLLVYYSQTL